MRNLILGLIVGLCCIFGVLTFSAAFDENAISKEDAVSKEAVVTYEEGVHYHDIGATAGLSDDSVALFFWYGCPHCYKLEESVIKENKERFDEWSLQYFHAAYDNPRVKFDFDIFVGLKQMGLDSTIGKDYMMALHDKGLGQDEAPSWLAEKGVPFETLKLLSQSDEAKNEFDFVSGVINQEEFNGVPAFVVNGQYLVPNQKDVLSVIEYLKGQSSNDS